MADSTTLATVEFHGAQLVTTIIHGVPHVAMRPLCEAIGLDWNGQYQRLTRHPVLGPVMCMTHTTGGDGKRYEMACLPLNMLNGWLFGVDASRVKPEAQERLLDYQRECFDVLANYWQKGGAINPRQSAQPALVGKSTGLPLAQRKKLCYIRQRCLKTPRLTVKPPRQCGFVMPEFRPVLGRMGLPVRASALLNPVFSTSCPPTLENVSGL